MRVHRVVTFAPHARFVPALRPLRVAVKGSAEASLPATFATFSPSDIIGHRRLDHSSRGACWALATANSAAPPNRYKSRYARF